MCGLTLWKHYTLYCSKYTEQRFFTAVPSVPCTGEIGFHEKIPVLEEIDFFTKDPYRENTFLVCAHCIVVCGYFPVCGPCVVVCEDVEIFIAPLCYGVWRLWLLQSSRLCKQFEIVSLYWRDWVFHKTSLQGFFPPQQHPGCAGDIVFFGSKIPVLKLLE